VTNEVAATIALAPDVLWSTKGSAFYWVVGYLATRLPTPEAKRRLREIDDNNLGWLALADFPPQVRDQMLRKIWFDLLADAQRRLPDPPHREEFVNLLRDLVDRADSWAGQRA